MDDLSPISDRDRELEGKLELDLLEQDVQDGLGTDARPPLKGMRDAGPFGFVHQIP
jgi:hypothetical protein